MQCVEGAGWSGAVERGSEDSTRQDSERNCTEQLRKPLSRWKCGMYVSQAISMTQALHEDQDDGYWVGHTSKEEALPRTGVGWAADVV